MALENLDIFLDWIDDEEGTADFINQVCRAGHVETVDVILPSSGDSPEAFSRRSPQLSGLHDYAKPPPPPSPPMSLAEKWAKEARQEKEAERKRREAFVQILIDRQYAPTAPTVPSKQDYQIARRYWTKIHKSFEPEDLCLVRATDNFYLEYEPIARFKHMHAYLMPITMADRLVRDNLVRRASVGTSDHQTSIDLIRAIMSGAGLR